MIETMCVDYRTRYISRFNLYLTHKPPYLDTGCLTQRLLTQRRAVGCLQVAWRRWQSLVQIRQHRDTPQAPCTLQLQRHMYDLDLLTLQWLLIDQDSHEAEH